MLNLIHVLIFQRIKPKFKVGDHAQILKYKNKFLGYKSTWTKDVLL